MDVSTILLSDERGILVARRSSSPEFIGTQYDDRAQKILFVRSKGYENDALILTFTTPDGVFEDTPANDEYVLTPLLTQHLQFSMGVTFARDGVRRESSNLLVYRLRNFPEGQTPPEPPAGNVYVMTQQNKITKLYETDLGVPMYHSALDDVDKELGGGGASNIAWYPTLGSDGELSWARSSTITPPATKNIMGPKGAPGAGASIVTVAYTLLGGADHWPDHAQNIVDGAITADAAGNIKLAQTATPEQYDAYAAAKPLITAQSVGSLTLKAYGMIPGMDIPVILEVMV